jgi:hypothetical protein
MMPDDSWWSLIRTQHAGYDNGYWQEMAYGFFEDVIKFRRNNNGTKSAWRTIAFTDSSITGRARLLETKKQDGSGWYGDSYPIYAQWESSSVCKLKCDSYSTKVDEANKLSTARTFTIGKTGKTFNGTANVSWTPYEMGVTRAQYGVGSNMNQVADHGCELGMVNLSGTDTTVNPNGATSWHHYINMTWSDCADNNGTTSNEWCTQIANKAGTTDLWVRSRSGSTIASGTAWVAPWTRILTGSNWTSVVDGRYLKLSGGTMAGDITLKNTGNTVNAHILRSGISQSWYQGRNSAMIKTTSYSGYDAILSMKTTAGDWSLGVYNDNKLYFTYILDSNYNAGTNTTTAQIRFDPDGTVVAPKFSGSLSGNATSANQASLLVGSATALTSTTVDSALTSTAPSLKINLGDSSIYNNNDGLILTASWSNTYGA